MIKTGWQGFPRFHVAFVIKRLLYIEFSVFRKKKKGGGGGGGGGGGSAGNAKTKLLHVYVVTQEFLVAIEFFFGSVSRQELMCRDMVLRF